MRTTIVIMFLALLGCQNQKPNLKAKEAIPVGCPRESDSPVSIAVLKGVFDTVVHYDEYNVTRLSLTSEDLDAEQRQIDSVRAWAVKLADSCVRYWYAQWLDKSQKDLDKAREVLAAKGTVPEPPFSKVR